MATSQRKTPHTCDSDTLHNFDEAAAHLKVVTTRQLRRWLENKTIGCTRMGGRVFFTTQQLDDYTASHTFAPSK